MTVPTHVRSSGVPRRLARIGLSAIAIALVSTARAQPVSPYEYALFDVEINGRSSQGFALNDLGHVVGEYFPIGESRAFVWSVTGWVDLGEFAPEPSLAWDISGTDVVVGEVEWPDRGAGFWDHGPFQNIGTLGGDDARARGVNIHGDIVGYSDTEPGISDSSAFLWRQGTLFDLGRLPGGDDSFAYDINDSSLVVGFADDPVTRLPVFWNDTGPITELPLLPLHTDGRAESVNSLGRIAGTSAFGSLDEAVIWDGGVPTSLHDTLVALKSRGHSINDLGDVVGSLTIDSDLPGKAFVWDEVNGMRVLEDLLPPNVDIDSIQTARDINNYGQITGDMILSNGSTNHAFLASPVVPTLSLSNPTPGLSGMQNTVTVTGAQPGAAIYLAYGTVGGGTVVLSCDIRLGTAVQIQEPTTIGPFFADGTGTATLTSFVPSGASNLGDVLIQAVDPANCAVSQLIVEVFE